MNSREFYALEKANQVLEHVPIPLVLMSCSLSGKAANVEIIVGVESYQVLVFYQKQGGYRLEGGKEGVYLPTNLFSVDEVLMSLAQFIGELWRIEMHHQFPPFGYHSHHENARSSIFGRMIKVLGKYLRKNLVEMRDRLIDRSLYDAVGKKLLAVSGKWQEKMICEAFAANNDYLIQDLIRYTWAAKLWVGCNGDITQFSRLVRQAMSNKSLNRSLANIPYKFPPSMMRSFIRDGHQILHRPLPKDRIVWLIVDAILRTYKTLEEKQSLIDALLRTDPKTLRRLLKRDVPDLRNGISINMASVSTLDPELGIAGRGKISWRGVIEASRIAHREEVYNHTDLSAECALPPIPLPNVKGLRFLDTVGAMVEEGEEMHHCVGWAHAEWAVVGRGYYFSFRDGKERATIQVYPDGRVGQSYGPWNKENGASKKAASILTEWGKEFPRKVQISTPEPNDFPF